MDKRTWDRGSTTCKRLQLEELGGRENKKTGCPGRSASFGEKEKWGKVVLQKEPKGVLHPVTVKEKRRPRREKTTGTKARSNSLKEGKEEHKSRENSG